MQRPAIPPPDHRSHARRAALVALGAAALVAQVGCEVDAWMFDPSVVGRWEHTPTVVPILDRIDVIESDTGEFVDVTEVLPEDLIPEAAEYRLGPGDVAQIEIMDIVVTGQPVFYERVVDRTGFLEIPQIGRIPVAGRTQDEARRMIEQAIIDQELVRDQPLVNLMVPGQRQATFSIFGAIQQPARYSIPYPDYRLLEAATDAGGVSPIIRHIFVIRQVPLSDAIDRSPAQAIDETQRPGEPIRPDRWTAPMDDDGDDEFQDIDDLIDELTNPESNPPVDPPGSPGVVGSASPRSHNVLEPHQALRPSHYDTYRPSPTALQDDDEPLIDLPDTAPPPPPVGGAIDLQARAQPVGPADGATGGAGAGRWVFIDGRWVQVVAEVPAAVDELPEGPDPLASGRGADDLLTQRVIRVPVAPLLRGVARYNIVVRPGDVIHVPAPEAGVVYAGGPGIARPGTYNLPGTGTLTLQRLVAAAGNLSAIGIPERVDLVRMVGPNRQAMIRLNYRAIAEGTQPDILLKPDDLLNFGTNFWATPLAVIRNGFRMSYGFGFLLDRNFGNDVFGAPPTNFR